ncbi:MAG: hypothetical protein WBE69_20600 [Candidatus Binataceae bacterium]
MADSMIRTEHGAENARFTTPTCAAREIASKRRLALPAPIGKWSLTSLQQRLVKTSGRLIEHARYYWLLLADSHLTPRLFGNMLQKIAALPSPAG